MGHAVAAGRPTSFVRKQQSSTNSIHLSKDDWSARVVPAAWNSEHAALFPLHLFKPRKPPLRGSCFAMEVRLAMRLGLRGGRSGEVPLLACGHMHLQVFHQQCCKCGQHARYKNTSTPELRFGSKCRPCSGCRWTNLHDEVCASGWPFRI